MNHHPHLPLPLPLPPLLLAPFFADNSLLLNPTGALATRAIGSRSGRTVPPELRRLPS